MLAARAAMPCPRHGELLRAVSPFRRPSRSLAFRSLPSALPLKTASIFADMLPNTSVSFTLAASPKTHAAAPSLHRPRWILGLLSKSSGG